MRNQLFEIEKETAIMQEIKNVENATFKIDSLTVDLNVKIIDDGGKFIDNVVIFFRDIKKAALSSRVKLLSFQTNKNKWTVSFKATGTLQDLNSLLTILNTDNIKINLDKKINH